MGLNLLSVVLLAAIITLGFFRKVNIGFLAILFAYPLGRMGGLTDNAIISGFNTSLFVTLLGVTMLFSIAQENGTLPFLTRGAVRLMGKRAYLLPPAVFLCSALLSASGPGPIPVMSIMNALAVSISWELGCSPILLTTMSVLGASAGAATPITSTGIVIFSLAEEYGITNITSGVLKGVVLRETLCAGVAYIVFRGYRLRGSVQIGEIDSWKVNREQSMTVIGILIMLSVILTFRMNIGLCSFVLSAILLMLYPIPSSQVFTSIPWDTLIMIGGMSLYMNIMIKLGGIDLLSQWLAGFMSPTTATAILSITAGVMSWFSSTTGVVLPTMIPMVPELSSSLGGAISPLEFIVSIASTAMVAGLSPFSTGGGLALASYSTQKGVSENQRRVLMLHFFLTSAGAIAFLALLELLLHLVVLF